ncbi:hypothetical protein EPYR_01628 [Erwinia pyrifoliae DSM 12163]|nr:hypothetical protein EPYR_01628 [Erwinia pyrifoliae DSM 12163]
MIPLSHHHLQKESPNSRSGFFVPVPLVFTATGYIREDVSS